MATNGWTDAVTFQEVDPWYACPDQSLRPLHVVIIFSPD